VLVGSDSQSANDTTQSSADAAKNPAQQPSTASSLTSTPAPLEDSSSSEAAAKPALKPRPKSPTADQDSPNLLQKLFKGSGGLY